MSDLSKLLESTVRPTVVSELTDLVNRTIDAQSGLTGMAIKSAISAAKKADAEVLPKNINRFLPNIIDALDPYWKDYNAADSAGFGNYLASRSDDVTSDILALGDGLAEKGPGAVQKIYSSLRGKAGKIITPALPELGNIVEQHAL